MKYPEKESSTLEFKATLHKNDLIIKTVIGFSNHKGGKIIVGVEDDGTIVGIPENDIMAVQEYIEKSIYENTNPPIIATSYMQRIADKALLIVEVYPGHRKPYYLKAKGLEKTYIRVGRSTNRANADTIEDLRRQSSGKEYDALPVYHATLDDLDKTAIEEFFTQRKSSKQLPKDYKDALLAYQLITREHTQEYPTVAGVLLFGKEPDQFIPEAMTICSRFKGIEGREALATRDCYGTLFDQFHEAYEFVVSKLNRSFVIDAPRRTEQLEIPETAIREAILNALLHRNYALKCPTKIAIYNNRVEISSPGSFPGPIKPSNIKEGYTFVRNSTLMKVFREMGYVEKLGTGIPAILKSFEERGLPEPEIRETDDFVKYVLRRPSQEHTPATDEEARILRLFESANELQISEIAIITSIPRATVGRKLNVLVGKGILKKIGTGRSTRYIRIK